MKIKKIIKSTFEGEGTESVTLTMTCSNRLHLFKKVLPSFTQYCKELILVSKVLIFDDRSSSEDRFEMERLAEELFPNINIDFVYFDEIPTSHRHAYIMQHWMRMIKTNYAFHLEDDRIMKDYFSIREAIDILKNDWNVAQVGFSQTLRQFPDEFLSEYRSTEHGKDKDIIYSKNSNYWIWPYMETKDVGQSMFYDVIRSKEGSEELNFDYWELFINYPPFNLQPSVIDINKLRLVGTIDLVDKLEASFGKKTYKYFNTVFSLKSKSIHIGTPYHQEQSAYDMNQSIR